jgi:N-acetyl-1-D-myo-inositol-2-amino-2-deoxy-alpha-D-glucopyranoside deacetylase
LLFVHAHPDDETLNNGATIAHYTARGASVRVVTCTLGEEGEVIGDQWAQLTVNHADQLGGYRITELSKALRCLGIDEPIFLGGAGRWRDSGMAGTESRPGGSTRFVDSGPAAVAALVEIIRNLRPHVVVTYDPNGGYGHPDHIRAHEVTTEAVAAAGGGEHPGEPWVVPKFYWTVTSAAAMAAAARELGPDDFLPHWLPLPPEGAEAIGYPDERITTVIDARDGLAAKIEALHAHATQVVVGPTGRSGALSNDLALPIIGDEHYVLISGASRASENAPGGGALTETDLLAGIDFE